MAGRRGGGRIENNGETEFVKLRSIRDSAATHEFADSEEVVVVFLFCKIQFFGTMRWAKCVVVIYSNFGRGRQKKWGGGVKTKVGLTKKRTYFFVSAAAAAVSQIIDLAGLRFQGRIRVLFGWGRQGRDTGQR